MALLFMKTILFRNQRKSTYTLLPTFGARDASFESTSSSSQDSFSQGSEKQKEKDSEDAFATSTFRIDPRVISDATIGLSDGSTVPFASTAGSSASGDTDVVIYGGSAELMAGSISMGLGGYSGARSEAQAYASALSETHRLITTNPTHAADLVRQTFAAYSLSPATVSALTDDLLSSPATLESFSMRFHHGLAESASTRARAYISALTIAGGYFFGGSLPSSPYFSAATNQMAFAWSVAVMVIALFAFGWAKTLAVGEAGVGKCAKSAVQMVVMGGTAAVAAMGCVKLVGS